MKMFYHTTNPENMSGILANGIRPSFDGLVYLADSVENAAKFGYFQNDGKEVVIFSVRVLKADAEKVKETHDHSEAFFQCKAYGYSGAVPKERLGAAYKWAYS